MKYLLVAILLAGCNNSSEPQDNLTQVSENDDSYYKKSKHFYAVNSDGDYGYETILSQDDINAGKVANTLVTFKYLGEKNGLFQLMHSESESFGTVFECENPCKYINAYVIADRQLIRKEVIAAATGSVGYLAIQDAINGHMKQYVFGKEGYQYTQWFSDSRLNVVFSDLEVEAKETQAEAVVADPADALTTTEELISEDLGPEK